jgi:hypothetical protein
VTYGTISLFSTSPERDILQPDYLLGNPYGQKMFLSKENVMSNFLWKLTPSRTWPTTDGTVDSCEWVRLHDHLGGIVGHYQIKFTYRTDDRQIHHGEFCHHGTPHIAPYTVGECLAIQYDPKKPSRYHFSGAGSNYEKLEAILVMTVFALLAGYVLYTF